jgi:hypothetical protein
VLYLSPEWLDAAAEALAGSPGLREAVREISLTLDQTVTDGPDGTVRWHVVLDHGDVGLIAGPAERSDLRFSTSYRVARAIARGELAAPMAFIGGSLRVGGDLKLLTAHQRVLATLDDVLVDVRKATTFDPLP